MSVLRFKYLWTALGWLLTLLAIGLWALTVYHWMCGNLWSFGESMLGALMLSGLAASCWFERNLGSWVMTDRLLLTNGRGLIHRDVFRFSFSPEELQVRSEPHHCFDAQLVYRADRDRFYDTYWNGRSVMGAGQPSGSGRVWTAEEVQRLGTLRFVCNLNDVVTMHEHERINYAPEDVFDLSYQHGCYTFWVKRRDAPLNQVVMLAELDRRIERAESAVQSASRDLAYQHAQRDRLVSGQFLEDERL